MDVCTMIDRDHNRLAEFLRMVHSLPPEDQRFLKRLIVELARREWPADSCPASDRILEITKDISPGRVAWVQRRLTP